MNETITIPRYFDNNDEIPLSRVSREDYLCVHLGNRDGNAEWLSPNGWMQLPAEHVLLPGSIYRVIV